MQVNHDIYNNSVIRHSGAKDDRCQVMYCLLEVVCRELGYVSAKAIISGVYGPGIGVIWLSNLYCTGTEDTVRHCAPDPGKHSCSHAHDVGVQCSMKMSSEYFELFRK